MFSFFFLIKINDLIYLTEGDKIELNKKNNKKIFKIKMEVKNYGKNYKL